MKQHKQHIHIKFNPHRSPPVNIGWRSVAINAAIASGYIPTAKEAFEAIEKANDDSHLQFQKSSTLRIAVSEKMAQLASKMVSGFWNDDISTQEKIELSLWQPPSLWCICAINRGIKLGFV